MYSFATPTDGARMQKELKTKQKSGLKLPLDLKSLGNLVCAHFQLNFCFVSVEKVKKISFAKRDR